MKATTISSAHQINTASDVKQQIWFQRFFTFCSITLTSFFPDVLDPATHYVPSGLSQSLTGTHTGPLLPGRKRERGKMSATVKIFKMTVLILWAHLCGFFFFIMFAETPEWPKTHPHTENYFNRFCVAADHRGILTNRRLYSGFPCMLLCPPLPAHRRHQPEAQSRLPLTIAC